MPGKMHCNVCKLTLNSAAQFEVHQTGKAHKRKASASGGSSANTMIRFVSSTGASDNDNEAESSDAAAGKDNAVFCSLCVVKLTSQAHADMHYAGSKHKRAVALAAGKTGEDRGDGVKRKCEDMCDVCNVPLKTKAVADAHYAGAKHEKKLKLSHNINTADPCPSYSSQGKQKKIQAGSMFYCSFCKISVNSQEQMDAHREGGKHKNAVNGIKRVVSKPRLTFTPRKPQEQNRFVSSPQEQTRYVSPPQEHSRYVNTQQEHTRYVSPQQEHTRYVNPTQEHTRFVSPPQEQNRFVSSSYNFQTGNYGNNFGSTPFRPAATMAYQSPHY